MRIERAQRASEVSAVGVSDDGGGVDRCLRAMTGGAGAPPRALEQHGRQHARRVREQIAPVESAAEDEMPDSGAAR